MTERRWRTSSYSGNQGECVEVAIVTRDDIGVRDTKDRDGGSLDFPRTAWRAFLDTVG